MTKEEALNILIKDADTNKISDGYHTFEELYEHRITLFIALCRTIHFLGEETEDGGSLIWKSEKHSDGTIWNGWFILGIGTLAGHQITYHLPTSKWDECSFAKVIEQAPEWDGHTSNDVLERIKKL